MKSSSNIEPELIFIDKVRNGVATIIVRWNITSETRVDPMNNIEYVMWVYDECWMQWILPTTYSTIEEIQSYLDANYNQNENILNWAMGSTINM